MDEIELYDTGRAGYLLRDPDGLLDGVHRRAHDQRRRGHRREERDLRLLEEVGRRPVWQPLPLHLRHVREGSPGTCGQYYKLFTAVIKPLVAYFSMILTELRQ